MRTLLKNLTIIPMDGEKRCLSGDILINGKKIESVGGTVDARLADSVRDCTGLIAIPGLVNGHTHLSMTLMRNYKDTCSNLQDWLGEIFPIEDRLNDDDIYWGSMLGLIELIKGGCTSFADMYFYPWMTARACKEVGVRGFLSVTLFGDEEETKKRLVNTERFDSELDGDLLRKDIAVHAIYTCSADTYRYSVDYAKANGLVVTTHLSETLKEVTDCVAQTGMKPADYLDSLGFFDVPCYTAHGVHLSDDEVRLMKEKNVGLVHNPSSNCKLASGIAPVSRFRKMGLTVGLGTDGASSNNNLSMIKEMRLAAMISTASTLDVAALPPYEVLSMATIDSARAIHADDRIGSLEVGKCADITLVNPMKANMTPLNDIYSALVFSLGEGNIDSVFINGQCVLDHGRLTTVDEELACREAMKRWAVLSKED